MLTETMTAVARAMVNGGHKPGPWRLLYPTVAWTRCEWCKGWVNVDGENVKGGDGFHGVCNGGGHA